MSEIGDIQEAKVTAIIVDGEKVFTVTGTVEQEVKEKDLVQEKMFRLRNVTQFQTTLAEVQKAIEKEQARIAVIDSILATK